MPKTYKWSDRHIFSDRFMVEVSYAHVGNNFALTFHEEDLRDVQPTYETTTGAYGPAPTRKPSTSGRPTASTSSATTSCRASLGGDHALKFGFKYRNDIAHTESMYGGDAYRAVPTAGVPRPRPRISTGAAAPSTACRTATSTSRTATRARG